MGGSRVYNPFIEYMMKHPGEVVTTVDLYRNIDLDPEAVRKAVAHALRHQAGLASALEVVTTGRAWRWNGNAVQPKPTAKTIEVASPAQITRRPARRPRLQVGDVLEVVGVNEDGRHVIRSSDGQLYTAVPL